MKHTKEPRLVPPYVDVEHLERLYLEMRRANERNMAEKFEAQKAYQELKEENASLRKLKAIDTFMLGSKDAEIKDLKERLETLIECEQLARENGDRLFKENAKLREALAFYADKENRSACLIDEYEFKEKYFKSEYIVDVMESEYMKDNGKRAREALNKESE